MHKFLAIGKKKIIEEYSETHPTNQLKPRIEKYKKKTTIDSGKRETIHDEIIDVAARGIEPRASLQRSEAEFYASEASLQGAV